MKERLILVMTEKLFVQLSSHLFANRELETMAIAFFKISHSPSKTKLLVTQLKVPTESNYIERSAGLVSLGPDFMEECFQHCEDNQIHLLDIHTHPWSPRPGFSPIDDSQAKGVKIPYLSEFLPRTEIAFALFGDRPEALRARIWNRHEQAFQPVNMLFVI